MPDARDRLTESDLEQIEALAHKDSADGSHVHHSMSVARVI